MSVEIGDVATALILWRCHSGMDRSSTRARCRTKRTDNAQRQQPLLGINASRIMTRWCSQLRRADKVRCERSIKCTWSAWHGFIPYWRNYRCHIYAVNQFVVLTARKGALSRLLYYRMGQKSEDTDS